MGIPGNDKDKQLLAKVHALDTLAEAVRQMRITGFSLHEITNLIPELYRKRYEVPSSSVQ